MEHLGESTKGVMVLKPSLRKEQSRESHLRDYLRKAWVALGWRKVRGFEYDVLDNDGRGGHGGAFLTCEPEDLRAEEEEAHGKLFRKKEIFRTNKKENGVKILGGG